MREQRDDRRSKHGGPASRAADTVHHPAETTRRGFPTASACFAVHVGAVTHTWWRGHRAIVDISVPTSLVTGGAGFIGSHLCDYLLARGHRLICVDNLDTGSLQNIEHVAHRDDFVFVNRDLTQPLFLEDEVDYVFHLASPASPIDYMRLPLHAQGGLVRDASHARRREVQACPVPSRVDE